MRISFCCIGKFGHGRKSPLEYSARVELDDVEKGRIRSSKEAWGKRMSFQSEISEWSHESADGALYRPKQRAVRRGRLTKQCILLMNKMSCRVDSVLGQRS